jgi:hypothetical protein
MYLADRNDLDLVDLPDRCQGAHSLALDPAGEMPSPAWKLPRASAEIKAHCDEGCACCHTKALGPRTRSTLMTTNTTIPTRLFEELVAAVRSAENLSNCCLHRSTH